MWILQIATVPCVYSIYVFKEGSNKYVALYEHMGSCRDQAFVVLVTE